MPRSLWTGTISFGLVNIPVKLYSAIASSNLNLDMIDKKDHSNIRYKRVNENTGKEVNYQDIVKAYWHNDEYVVIDKEDFEEADAKKTKTIEILNFVQEKEISSIYYEQPYYLEPESSGTKAYGVLRDALAQSGKVGVATFVLRNKEALAILKPYDKVIVLNRIHFQEEIKSFEELNLPQKTKITSREQLIANKLIDELTEHFDISKYKNTYTDKLLQIIKEKAKGGKKPHKKLKVVHVRTKSDLMESLQASLQKMKKAS